MRIEHCKVRLDSIGEAYIPSKKGLFNRPNHMWCHECFAHIYDESMWRVVTHGMHGSSASYYCKHCYPTKESLAQSHHIF